MAKNPSDYLCSICCTNSSLLVLFEVVSKSELELVTWILIFQLENMIGYSLDEHSMVDQKSTVAQ
jgi:hypothetical protein